MERQFRYKKIQEMADSLGAFLSIGRQVGQIRSFLAAQLVRDNAQAIAILFPKAVNIIEDWLRELDEMKSDLSYRERALRAEKQVRDMKKEAGK